MTAEVALAIPAILLLLGAVAGAGQVGRAALSCQDGAAAAARAAARGDSVALAQQIGARQAPPGAQVAVSLQADQVSVRVQASVQLRVPGVPAVAVSGRAAAQREESAQ